MFLDNSNKIFLNYGTGKNMKVLKLSEVNMDNDKACISLFSCSYWKRLHLINISQIKESLLKLLGKNINYVRMFQLLGSTWELGDALFRLLEAYMCALFGKKI